jgi:hypothetical protein
MFGLMYVLSLFPIHLSSRESHLDEADQQTYDDGTNRGSFNNVYVLSFNLVLLVLLSSRPLTHPLEMMYIADK